MVKRVFLIHGWGGSPERDWFPWGKQELEKLGYEVHVPLMPDTDYPKIEAWVAALSQEIGKPQESDILIGHSIGCQTILRYLEALQEGQKLDKAIFVAGWHTLGPESFPTEEDQEIAQPWIETPINFENVKGKVNSFICLFSDNDPDVPLDENKKWFSDNLPVQVIVEHEKGHFTTGDGVIVLPVLLDLIKNES